MAMVISGQTLINIASEIVSTVEGASGIGIEYEDVVEIICELLVEKLDIGIASEAFEEIFNNISGIDKSEE